MGNSINYEKDYTENKIAHEKTLELYAVDSNTTKTDPVIKDRIFTVFGIFCAIIFLVLLFMLVRNWKQ